MLQEKFDTRRICMIGAAKHLDQELEVLHRSVRVINDELMDIEADQKHVPRLLEDFGLIQRNVVQSPRVKLSATESNVIENSSIHEGEQQRCSGVEPCDVRTWRKIVQTSLKRSSVWHEECRNQEPVT